MTTQTSPSPWSVPVMGVRADLHRRRVPHEAAYSANNVLVRDGTLRPRFALTNLDTTGASWYPCGMTQFNSEKKEGEIVVCHSSGWAVLNQDTGAWSSLIETDNDLLGSRESHGIFRTFERDGRTYLLGANGTDLPKVWDGESSSYRNIEGSTVAARALVVSGNRVIELGLGPDRMGLDVSAFNNFDAGWNQTQTLLLGDTPGEIMAGLEIDANRHYVYKTDAIYAGVATAEFYGVLSPFRWDPVRLGIKGPVSPRALAGLPDGRHCWLAEDAALYTFDGGIPQSMGRHIQEYIYSTWSWTHRRKSWMILDSAHSLLMIFYPHAGGALQHGLLVLLDAGGDMPWPIWPITLPQGMECSAALDGLEIDELTIGDFGTDTIATLVYSLGSYTTRTPALFMGMADGTFYTQKWADDGSYNDDGVPIACALETGWAEINEPSTYKTINEIHHQVELEPGEALDVTLLAEQSWNRELVSGPQTVTAATPETKSSHRESGRRFALQMANSANRLWRWDGALMHWTQKGLR